MQQIIDKLLRLEDGEKIQIRFEDGLALQRANYRVQERGIFFAEQIGDMIEIQYVEKRPGRIIEYPSSDEAIERKILGLEIGQKFLAAYNGRSTRRIHALINRVIKGLHPQKYEMEKDLDGAWVIRLA